MRIDIGISIRGKFVLPNTHNPSLSVNLDTGHEPLDGWNVFDEGGAIWVSYRETTQPIYVGRQHSWKYTYNENRKKQTLITAGLSRTGYGRHDNKFRYRPEDWNEEFNFWPELIYPTAYAESFADFTSMNFWDRAGFTPGFIQLAAHTKDDLFPLFERLIREIPTEAAKFFPELSIIEERLTYVSGTQFRFLDVSDSAEKKLPVDTDVERGLFMGFFNHDRTRLDVGNEEQHAAARWLIWSLTSPEMRRIQVASSVENMQQSLDKLHKLLIQTARRKYPNGVDGMRCDHLAAALAVPHLAPAKTYMAVGALKKDNVLRAFERLNYGPGKREKNVVDAIKKRGGSLSNMKFDFSLGHPVRS